MDDKDRTENSFDCLRMLPAGAGYFYDLASHQLDFLDFLFGEITEATGKAENVAGLYEVEDTVDASWKHINGVTGIGHWEFASPINTRTDEVEFIGSEGSMLFSTFHFLKKSLSVSLECKFRTKAFCQ